MDIQSCPRCKSSVEGIVLYQCVRCFTVYCKNCNDTKEGRLCPKCGMSQRMVISPDK